MSSRTVIKGMIAFYVLLFFLYLEAAKIWRLWRRQASANA